MAWEKRTLYPDGNRTGSLSLLLWRSESCTTQNKQATEDWGC